MNPSIPTIWIYLNSKTDIAILISDHYFYFCETMKLVLRALSYGKAPLCAYWIPFPYNIDVYFTWVQAKINSATVAC